MPEVSLMLPLCDILQISINELLSGERVGECDYKSKAEENMVKLIKENEQNKKNMILSIICGIITIIAVCALVIIASYVELPVYARIIFIGLAIVTAIVGIGAAAMLEIDAGYYECPYCKALFIPTVKEYIKGYHTFTKRRLTCHECGKTGMCKHRIIR